ncbi:hypothetical protein BegalDRAFT_2377 [Beggiatoa alba B18LD]|uniref:Uncharacterized protein n=1 Tax=Beggiatoa alba B18LD TaxID=395493 RepID=I3CHY7_9GAMM|nr:hypothetical protein [Beggiatoa alba]EIJ43230.1 hypothetical protein BegalDRAFT_2377 [Beggiatoa alba B18LD]
MQFIKYILIACFPFIIMACDGKPSNMLKDSDSNRQVAPMSTQSAPKDPDLKLAFCKDNPLHADCQTTTKY